jgi:hypothetical protein
VHAPRICTSARNASTDTIQPYAPRIALAQWAQNHPEQIVQLIRDSNTVIIETVERDFFNRAAQPGREGAVLTPGFLSSLPKQLGPPPR